MTDSGFQMWSKTAATNASADGAITYAEGQAPSSINDSARAAMAVLAKWRDDNSGSLTTGGSATAFTVTTNTVFTTLALLSGQTLTLTFNATNGAAATLNVDSLGAKALQTASGTAIPTGMILANSVWRVTYFNSIPAFIVHGIPAVLGGQAFSANITPATNDGAALGTAALEWSDLFLASGSIINWANGDAVLTHSADTLTLTGANMAFGAGVSAISLTVSGNNVLTTASVADQAAQETATSITTYTSPGRQQFHPGHPKTWGFVTVSGGTPSLTSGYNVASLTDTNPGQTTINLSTAFSDTNYAVIATPFDVSDAGFLVNVTVESKATGSFLVRTWTANGAGDTHLAGLDNQSFMFAAFGDQ